MSALVFPANPPEALVCGLLHLQRGERVLGATAFPDDPLLQGCYSEILPLPHLSDEAFAAALEQMLAGHGIDRILTTQNVVRNRLGPLCREQGISLEMLAIHPQQALLGLCSRWIEALSGEIGQAPWPPARRELDDLAREALLFRALSVPGGSGPLKLLALCRLMASAVSGDLVEIGVAWGRSAWILAALAKHWQLGRFLGVDLWRVGGFVQDVPLIDQATAVRDYEATYRACCSLFWPALAGEASLLRLPSTEAASLYGGSRQLSHPLLGEVAFSGRISVLHVDGNHALASVQADLEAWSPYLAPGAWVVIDDYHWRYGDGPRQAGDAFAAAHTADLDSVFCLGNSLYLHFKEE